MSEPVGRDALQDLVRGRLSPEEAARLEAEIAGDPQMEADYRLVDALNRTDTASHAFPGELGWARLSRAIDREKPRALWRRDVPLWQVAAILAIALFGWQFAVAPHLGGGAPERYVTATEGAARAGPTLRVAFTPTGTEGSIRSLLREAGARIVDGPTAIGIYTLAFENGGQRDAAATRFAASPSLIEIIASD